MTQTTMTLDRRHPYDNLSDRIGNTPLIRFQGEVPHGNRIWIKREYDNPFGSHYDRVYLALFDHFEKLGIIKPGSKVLETTSGTAGVSYAGIGRELGYECHVAIPKGMDNAVIEAIRQQGATPYFTPEQDYIAGFPTFLRSFLREHRGEFTFLNHSMTQQRGPGGSVPANNETTLQAMAGITREIQQELPVVDYFIPAVGNGSSILGPAMELEDTTKVVVFESFQSAVAYDQKCPGDYERRYGIKPGTLPRHKLRGTSYPGIDFPHIRNAITQGIIDDVALVSDAEIDRHYHASTGRDDTVSLPHWDVQFMGHKDLGKTGRAGIAVALRLAEKVADKNLVIIAYDKAERYDR
ncbi:pyridoxal-phosphate dependent enzyme [Candidatus Woesearchaeota archaeon]|nr:pyridoxal-phosphate dependent enzyme [Candidatus Woesearchaeota archaeon]